MLFLELFGAIFSIAGAFLMSKATKDETKWIYYAFCSFFVSNLCLFAFFLLHGKIPIVIQMVLFFSSAVLGIVKLSNNKLRDTIIVSVITFFYMLSMIHIINKIGISNIDFSISIIDTIASTMAIIGSFILSAKNHITRSYAFLLFLLADIIFVYIGYSNGFYMFMTQSAIYIYTSSKGYYNTMKTEIQSLFNKTQVC